MSHELLYTSIPPGLIPGRKGFCTVARTGEIPGRLTELIEQSLSDYRYSAEGNPPAVWSHLRVREGLRELSVLSRKTPIDDHSGRPSVFAHHVILGPDELPEGGPAWVLGQRVSGQSPPDFLLPAWDGHVGSIAAGRKPRSGDRRPGRCTAWEGAGLDPGWAGVLAELFLNTADQPAVIVASADRDLLPLVEDAVALLPAERRWAVTFSTYYTGLPPTIPCAWRFVLAGSPEAKQAARLGRGLYLDLDNPGEPRGGGLVEQARTGIAPARTVVRPGPIEPGMRPGLTPRLRREVAVDPVDADVAPTVDSHSKSRMIAAIAAAAVAGVLLVGGAIAWIATQGENNVKALKAAAKKNSAVLAHNDEPKAADPAPEPPKEPPKAAPEPSKEVRKEAPKAVAKVEPLPEPDPLTAPIKSVSRSNTDLPRASEEVALHVKGDKELSVTLSKANRFALRLLGLRDPEILKLGGFLVSRPTSPGHDDRLIVERDPASGGKEIATVTEMRKLAEFWIERSRLHFQWADDLSATLADSSRALRDCTLEIRGGGVRQLVTLRPLVDDKVPVHVKDVRTIWQEKWERPIRQLAIASCQIKAGEQDWKEVPPLIGEGDWQRRLVVIPDDPKGGFLILTVGHADDPGRIAPTLPDMKKRVENARAAKAKCEKSIANLSTSLRASNDRLARFQAYRRETAPSLDENGRAELDAQDKVFYEQTKAVEKNLNDEKKKLEEAEGQIKVQETLRTASEPFLSALIRVKIEMTVEGQKVEVARIGPW